MTLEEILELDVDGYAINKIETLPIYAVGEIKEDDHGKYQIVLLGTEDKSLKVYLRCENLFVKDSDEGRYMTLRCGGTNGGKPIGLTLRIIKGKQRVNVSTKANQLITDGKQTPTEEPHQEEEENERSEDWVDPDEGATNSSAQLTESHEEEVEYMNDEAMRETFAERLHMLKILEQENEKVGKPFTRDQLVSWMGGIILDAISAKRKDDFLTPVKKKSKPADRPKAKDKKFESYDKPHQDSAPDKSAPAKEEPVLNYDDYVDKVLGKDKSKKYLDVKNKKGATVFEVFTGSRERRANAAMWYCETKNSGSHEDDEVSLKFFNAVSELNRDVPLMTQLQLWVDAVLMDLSLIRDVAFEKMEETDSDNAITKLLKEKGQTMDKAHPMSYALFYFSVPVKEREQLLS